MNTTNINKKKNTSIRFTLKMLLWAAVGGLLGFLASWFGMQTEMVGRFFSGLTVRIQSIMLPLVIVITIAGIVYSCCFCGIFQKLSVRDRSECS